MLCPAEPGKSNGTVGIDSSPSRKRGDHRFKGVGLCAYLGDFREIVCVIYSFG
jgi:hypothetical protein